MSILNSSIVPASAGGYEIANSLRFDTSGSPRMIRTPSSASNRKTWTYSCWVKKQQISNARLLISAGVRFLTGDATWIIMRSDDTIEVGTGNSSAYKGQVRTYAKFRDPSAWYHIVVAVDSTQGTATDRAKIYVNGIEQDCNHLISWTSNYDSYFNSTYGHETRAVYDNNYVNSAYLSEWHFIDGQALDPSNFGETGDYGEWKPIEYTGTYGTNGFYLDFENSGSLGADVSGNGNNWTPNNLAATDQVKDSPTNNFATLNPLVNYRGYTLSEGNTKLTYGTPWGYIFPTMTVTDKSYWECLYKGQYFVQAISSINTPPSAMAAGSTPEGSGYGLQYQPHTGSLYYNGGEVVTGLATCSTGDIIGLAVDSINQTFKVYRNNTLLTTYDYSSTLLSENEVYPSFAVYNASGYVNFGQDSSFAGNKTAQGNTDDNGYGDFYYTPPTGYLALCTQNLPDPAVIPSEHFNTKLYTGNNSTKNASGIGFQPDFVWIKCRSVAHDHMLMDAVRGATKNLYSNGVDSEGVIGLQSFDSDGFTTQDNVKLSDNGQAYVAWNWKANGSGVSNTDGSITSTVSANVDAGFSIVSYTGASTLSTVGHGLSQAPELITIKARTTGYGYDWITYNKDVGNTKYLTLNNADASATYGFWNNTTPTSSVFTIGNYIHINDSSADYIAYCFHSVDGFSKVGSYTGNGSTDGTFVYTGFRPAYVMVKGASSAESWVVIDNARDDFNVSNNWLKPNSSDAEFSPTNKGNGWDLVSNGFKIRNYNDNFNTNGDTYIYIAFAESPFKHTNAR